MFINLRSAFLTSLGLLAGFLFACAPWADSMENAVVQKTQDESEIAFVFFGDFGTGTPDQMRIARTMKDFCGVHRCDFLLTLGDNIYDSGVTSADDPLWLDRVESPYGPLGIPMYAVLGNHDYRSSFQAQIDHTSRSNMWRMPSRYYSFQAGHALFMGIDTNNFDATHTQWLQNEFASNPESWKIVFGHHPVASYGHHGPKEELSATLAPILSEKADIYFAGHDHDKQVIRKENARPLYVVSGTAAKTRPVHSGEGTLFAASTLGFGYMVVRKNSAELRFIDEIGRVEYSTVINK